MTLYTCYIVDDEPLAVKVIQRFLNKLPQFNVMGCFTDPFEAYNALKSQPVDLLFLDIEMPDFNGLDLIKSLIHRPEIILTTAFREFAADGFDLNILDYLVKPIEFSRFMNGIDKFLDKQSPDNGPLITDLTVRANRKFVKLKTQDILYIEGIKDYVKIVLTDQEIITKQSIGNFGENNLPMAHFIRVHKSFIVSRAKITAYSHHSVELGRKEIPIGRLYKDHFLEQMNPG